MKKNEATFIGGQTGGKWRRGGREKNNKRKSENNAPGTEK